MPPTLADLLRAQRRRPSSISRSAANTASAHIPGAWFAIRSRLALALQKMPLRGTLVLTSEDGVLAGLAVARGARTHDRFRCAISTAATRPGRRPACAHADDPRMADEPIDVWLKPYERPNDARKAMAEYLAWETDLLPRIERDGSAKFRSGPVGTVSPLQMLEPLTTRCAGAPRRFGQVCNV